MFFEKDLLSFNILDVFEIKQKKVTAFNSERNFNALSFRFHADTRLTTSYGEYLVGDNCVCYVPARLDYSRISGIDELIVVHFETTNYNTRDIECFSAKSPTVFAELFQKILTCWNKKELGYKYKCSAILYEIFAECYTQNYQEKQQSSKIKKSVDYINKSFKRHNLSIKEIADRSFISEVYFRKLFKKEFGTTPQKYIVNLRIQHAIGLISTGYYSLKEIAYESGYSDYKYFSVEFKKSTGVSPSEYRYNFNK